MMRCAVVTISDKAFAGLREDASGPAVAQRLKALGHAVSREAVLPDEPALITQLLIDLAGSGAVDAVLTTGGTGITARDRTPEATRAALEIEIPGFSELMRLEGLRSTRRAVFSRAVCGARGQTLIVNLPGSPKGAVESLDAIVDLLPHAVELLQGSTEHGPEPQRS